MKCPFKDCIRSEMTAYGLAIHLRQRHKNEVRFPIYIRFCENGSITILDGSLTRIAPKKRG